MYQDGTWKTGEPLGKLEETSLVSSAWDSKLPMQRARVQPLVWKLRSHMP